MSIKETYKLQIEGDYATTEILGKKYGFRKWTWGEKNALNSECSSVNPMTGGISYDQSRFNEQLLLKTVVKFEKEQPVPFTVEEIRALDGQLGERLYQITAKLNLITNVETENL